MKPTTKAPQAYPVPAPDLVVTGMTLTPASPSAKGTFSADITLMNPGTATGLPRTLQGWTNQPLAWPCLAVPSLAASVGTTIRVTGLPAGPIGAKTLRAFIDSGCLTPESNEINNQKTQARLWPFLA